MQNWPKFPGQSGDLNPGLTDPKLSPLYHLDVINFMALGNDEPRGLPSEQFKSERKESPEGRFTLNYRRKTKSSKKEPRVLG